MESVRNVREESDNVCDLPGEGAPTLEPGGRSEERKELKR